VVGPNGIANSRAWKAIALQGRRGDRQYDRPELGLQAGAGNLTMPVKVTTPKKLVQLAYSNGFVVKRYATWRTSVQIISNIDAALTVHSHVIDQPYICTSWAVSVMASPAFSIS
jgi:hypothetical protein